MPLTFARLLSYPANAPYWTPEIKYTPVCLLDHLQLAPLKHLRSCKERRYSSRVLLREKLRYRLLIGGRQRSASLGQVPQWGKKGKKRDQIQAKGLLSFLSFFLLPVRDLCQRG